MRRRPALGLVLLVALAVCAAGCSAHRPGTGVTTPTPSAIVGKPPTPPVVSAAAGKAIFLSQGCAACHTFTPAGAKGTVGPDLDKLAQYAKVANQGSLKDFVSKSITDPGAYVEKGFANGIMPGTYASLSQAQLAALVAFLTAP